MSIFNKKNPALIGMLIFLFVQPIYAGPPFNTDDPQPVDFRHWECNGQSNIFFPKAAYCEAWKRVVS
jgi:hypothetical protein